MVNYPNGLKRTNLTSLNQKKQSTSRRGYSLEKSLNASNEYYLISNRAIIHKKPTPVQIVKVDYPMRSAAKITEAYFKIPSTTDYNGLYKGRYIDFEAKECQRKYFPFQNIHPHQIEHLKKVIEHGGIAFLVIAFVNLDEVYLIDANYVIQKYEDVAHKSISYDSIKSNGHIIPRGFLPQLDYLKVVDHIYFKED